jgi:4'-phosphopantetheinyl transferase
MSDDPMTKLTLGRDEAHLWVTEPEEIEDRNLLLAYERLMTEEERKRRDRFRFEKDRHRYLVTRALVRTVLSKYARVSPASWRFVANEHGRPEIAEPRQVTSLKFNLSHTNQVITCLVAKTRDVGIDVENRERRGRLLDVARRFFSRYEVETLYSLPDPDRLDRFFMYWTLKESYIKAKGLGLSIPLSQFSFDFDSPQGISIFFDPRLQDEPSHWQFWLFSYGPKHLIASSVQREPGETISLTLRKTVPLQD